MAFRRGELDPHGLWTSRGHQDNNRGWSQWILRYIREKRLDFHGYARWKNLWEVGDGVEEDPFSL